MIGRGHNERSYRLDALASEAQDGLANVEKGEEFTVSGWLAYGHALNEARALFPGDREFGEWTRTANLAERNGRPVHDHDRAAAMWAAANADEFEVARADCNARTVRGIHEHHKQMVKEREAEERRKAQEAALNEAAKAEAETNEAAKPTDNEEERVAAQLTVDGYVNFFKDHNASEAQGEPEEITAPDDEPPAADPDPNANLRREFRSMTRDGQEDDWIGLREENAALRLQVKEQRAEIAALKARIKDMSEGDQGATISRLHKQIVGLKGARDDAKEKSAKEIRRANFLKKERDEAQRQLQSLEVPLN